ncbi:MAG: efflux RND transporter periplasmic adaptor subunit [Bacteroidales bacterium]|jgi:HlyD family secretion protein|nr:efflux RND transporter periplasmic adaptor subunit [Bacteroidales bacterium]MBQ2530934.1 efflux RND transporter periplasmic adaptor subunit [Bacteroidales bacterium]MBQ5410271.1 efflux RND transporter periplasmic adaptor subunit [Bacteroidales bacterium]MBQ5485989.1 efflux RND transporter periplasmic adaptor subunit [Bacteroidales bacterium]MEE3476138.1 efflux RND transporter periplasmic adaptor subunit [Candidatus Cryptobacteroides sp.]
MEREKKSYNLVIGIAALILIILAIAIIGYFVSKPKPLVIQGEAEASEYRVSGKVPGRIEELFVKEGQAVHKGDTVAMIDSPEVRAKLAQANAARSAAAAQSSKARNGARSEQIQGAYQLWQQAIVQEDVMKKSLDRVSKLYEQKVVAAQKYDETKAQYDAAVAQTKAAKSQYDMAVNGARYEDKAAAQALVAQANGAVQEVESYLGELYLIAPADGIISAIYPKVGELVGQGSPVASVLDVDDIWFTFNVREDYLHGLKQGDGITVIIPALDGKEIPATVNYIAVRESYATWKATKETGMYDAKTFEVRAVPTQKTEGILPGMSAIIKQ